MSLGQILRQKREELGYTLDEVSNRIGFSKPYLSTIETGKVKNPPSDEVLTKLEKTLGFKTGTLLYLGHVEGLPSDIRQEWEAVHSENQKWREVAKSLTDKKMGPAQVKRLLSKRKLKTRQDKKPIPAGRQVPVINRVQAGYPRDFDDLDYPVGIADDYVRCPDVHDPNAFAVRVVGDSMEPTYSRRRRTSTTGMTASSVSRRRTRRPSRGSSSRRTTLSACSPETRSIRRRSSKANASTASIEPLSSTKCCKKEYRDYLARHSHNGEPGDTDCGCDLCSMLNSRYSISKR
jgi:transcriptional regulator with XRE-family HTH domain